MSIDYFSPRVNGIKLSCIQFFVAGALSLIVMAVTEHPDLHVILHYWASILYTGILSSAVGYTLQIVAQKHAEPTQATLIMCMESVFAAVAGAVVLSERMSGREFLGCAIIFIAVIISVLPERKRRGALKG
jgi:drug/metabolite transporter (DMT)-like permease